MKRFNADGGDEELQFEITLNNFYLGDPVYFIEDTGVSGIIYEEVYDEWLEFVEQFYFGADCEFVYSYHDLSQFAPCIASTRYVPQ